MTSPTAAAIAIIMGSFHLAATAGDQANAVSKTETQTFSIHPKLPPFTCRIVRDRTLGGSGGEVCIDVRGGPKDYLPQTLEPWVILDDVIEVLDLNFDGYKDIRILCDRGNRGDEIHECWLYDSPRRRFVPAPDFSMIDEVDHKRRLLISWSSGGVAYSNESTYRLRNGIPELVREVSTDYALYIRDLIPSRYTDDTVVKITRLYKNGRLVRTFYTTRVL